MQMHPLLVNPKAKQKEKRAQMFDIGDIQIDIVQNDVRCTFPRMMMKF